MLDDLLTQLVQDPENTKLVFMPISRIQVESVCEIGGFRVYPPGVIDLENFRPIPNKELRTTENEFELYQGQELREIQTSLTGFDRNILDKMPLVVFTAEVNWEVFLDQNHAADTQLLKQLSAIAERAFDLIRFHLCRFDLPDTLPGKVGSWDGSGAYQGAMIYTLPDHESYLIAGEAIDCSIVAKGIGLDLDIDISENIPTPTDGEVANVAIHALSLYSDVMTANSDTIKFSRAMTLLEFLASPDEYKNWKSLKGDIVCHCASDITAYHRLSQRFKELTSFEDPTGKQIGLRTLVVHHGRFIDDIIPNLNDRRSLFRELQTYAGSVLNDMLENKTMTWDRFQSFRNQKKQALGV